MCKVIGTQFRNINILALYRDILHAAKVFPSSKREKIILEIKREFRANKNEHDSSKLDICINLAKKGLHQLSMYSSLDRRNSSWAVNLDQEPMPKPPPKPK